MVFSDVFNGVSDFDRRLFIKYMGYAKDFFRRSVRKDDVIMWQVGNFVFMGDNFLQNFFDNMFSDCGRYQVCFIFWVIFFNIYIVIWKDMDYYLLFIVFILLSCYSCVSINLFDVFVF